MQNGFFSIALFATNASEGTAWVSTANVAYLVAAVLFILGIKGMTHPRTAVRGNLTGSIGMLVAVVATLLCFGDKAMKLNLNVLKTRGQF